LLSELIKYPVKGVGAEGGCGQLLRATHSIWYAHNIMVEKRSNGAAA